MVSKEISGFEEGERIDQLLEHFSLSEILDFAEEDFEEEGLDEVVVDSAAIESVNDFGGQEESLSDFESRLRAILPSAVPERMLSRLDEKMSEWGKQETCRDTDDWEEGFGESGRSKKVNNYCVLGLVSLVIGLLSCVVFWGWHGGEQKRASNVDRVEVDSKSPKMEEAFVDHRSHPEVSRPEKKVGSLSGVVVSRGVSEGTILSELEPSDRFAEPQRIRAEEGVGLEGDRGLIFVRDKDHHDGSQPAASSRILEGVNGWEKDGEKLFFRSED